MLNCANLRKTGTGWEFESEVALEDFVWTNLKQLLGLTPRKRQYRVNGQICDIVAVDENKRLVVLELKNVEDRGIVQQLTRYYDALLDEKPFHEEIDYEQPVSLVAITPTFHKDNLTDRKYHRISFHFLQFKIIQDEDKLYLQLKDIDTQQVSQLEILHKEKNDNNEIPSPPRICRTLLSKCTDYEQEAILKIREESSKAYFGRNPSYKSPLAMSLQYYMKLIGKTDNFTSLDMLVDMALEKWLEKL
jgi:RecB family endonuclease NucS